MGNGDKKTIFITGGTGLLGNYLIKTALEIYNICSTFFPADKENYLKYDCSKCYVDIRNKELVLNTIKEIRPDCVIHTVSLANVDYVEKNKDEARRTNLGGTTNIIEACKEISAKLIYISSNAVFDGENPPYSEEDPVSPLNYYGELKTREEKKVKESGLKYAIVRPILMYGWNLQVERKNSVTWLIDLLKAGKEVNIVDDIYCNPLFVEDCCTAIWRIISLGKEGIFHVGGRDEMNRYEFACTTAEVFGFSKDFLRPIKNSFFADIAPRAQNTTYCIDKIEKELNFFPRGVREGLEVMKQSEYENT